MTSPKRSLLKAVTWRIGGSLVTLLMVGVITGNGELAVIAAMADASFKFIAYYAHERIWDRIQFGRGIALVSVEDYDMSGGDENKIPDAEIHISNMDGKKFMESVEDNPIIFEKGE